MTKTLLVSGIVIIAMWVIDLPRSGGLVALLSVFWLVALMMELTFLECRIEVLEKQLKENQPPCAKAECKTE